MSDDLEAQHSFGRAENSTGGPPGPTGTSGWHRVHAFEQEPPRSLPADFGEPVYRLKQRAQVAIPFIRQRVDAWTAGQGGPAYFAGTLKYGSTAAARNTIYTSAWLQLSPEHGRYWFEGAAMVTGGGGIKDLEGHVPAVVARTPLLAPTPEDLAFIVAGNAFLYPYNLHNFYVLRGNGQVPGFEWMKGRELDRGLVVLEQSLVQSFIDVHEWTSLSEKVAALHRLSRGFQSYFGNDWLKGIVQRLFGERFDFGNIDDRIRLGWQIVERLRSGR